MNKCCVNANIHPLRAVILNHPLYLAMEHPAKEVIETFRKRGLQIGTTTGFMSEKNKCTVSNIFMPDVSQHPYSSILIATIRDLGARNIGEIALIDSCPKRLEEGKKAGCWTIAVPDGSQSMQSLMNRKCAHFTVNRIDQAAHIVTYIDDQLRNEM